MSDINGAFATLPNKQADALLVVASALFTNYRAEIIALAARYAVPAIYAEREFTNASGLMSYGPNSADQSRRAGVYTGRVLKGERPGDLPIVRPIKFDFVINLTTAKTLGIEVPPTLLALADEAIE